MAEDRATARIRGATRHELRRVGQGPLHWQLDVHAVVVLLELVVRQERDRRQGGVVPGVCNGASRASAGKRGRRCSLRSCRRRRRTRRAAGL
jgi:hypothetical protein